jgi:hypothetical protein
MKNIIVCFVFFASFSANASNQNELSRCVLAYWKASGLMASIGNSQQQSNFMKAGNDGMNAGLKVFGQGFKSVLEKNKSSVAAMNDQQLLPLIQSCNNNLVNYVR